MSWHEQTFGSIAEMAAYVTTTARMPGAGDNSAAPDFEGKRGSATLADAVSLAVNGWQEGATLAGKALAARKRGAGERPRSTRQRSRFDVSGDEVDVGRYLAGDPECMIERRRAPVKGRTVRVVNVAVSCAWDVPGAVLMRYAVAVCATVQRMEASGVRVELWARAKSGETQAGRGGLTISVRVKGADSRLHPAALAFACGHPSFQRRLIAGCKERHPKAWRMTAEGRGYGYATGDDFTGYLTSGTKFGSTADVEAAIRELDARA